MFWVVFDYFFVIKNKIGENRSGRVKVFSLGFCKEIVAFLVLLCVFGLELFRDYGFDEWLL